MTPARSEIEIRAPADRVWRLLTEFRSWPEWGPSVRGVASEKETVAPGVTGRVETAVGVSLPFEIKDFEEGRYWDWSVAGVRATGHRVTPLSGDRTRVAFTVSRLFWPYVWILSRGLRRLKEIAEAEATSRPPGSLDGLS
jgi:uncharacterized protein YndB with AHSA1/START domain